MKKKDGVLRAVSVAFRITEQGNLRIELYDANRKLFAIAGLSGEQAKNLRESIEGLELGDLKPPSPERVH